METEKVLHFLLHSIVSYAIVFTIYTILHNWLPRKSSLIYAVIISVVCGLIKEYVIDFYPTTYQLIADLIGVILGAGICLLL